MGSLSSLPVPPNSRDATAPRPKLWTQEGQEAGLFLGQVALNPVGLAGD